MVSSTKRSILITGCSQGGAGNALALEFLDRGFRVFATARSLASMANLDSAGVETFTLNVTSLDSINGLKDEIHNRTGGKLDILFNNAGIMYEAPSIEADAGRVRQMFDTNVFGLFDVVQTFTPLLIAAVHGSRQAPTIVNVASVVSRIPFLFSSAYNASKAAVTSYSDTLRLEVEPLGLRVVTVFMGEVSTGLMSADNINFGADSLYAEVEANVRQRSIDHAKSSILPRAFAWQVVEEVLQPQTSYIWKGTNAVLIWFLNAIGHRKIFDSTMKKAVGLDQADLRRDIYERGQRLAKPR